MEKESEQEGCASYLRPRKMQACQNGPPESLVGCWTFQPTLFVAFTLKKLLVGCYGMVEVNIRGLR